MHNKTLTPFSFLKIMLASNRCIIILTKRNSMKKLFLLTLTFAITHNALQAVGPDSPKSDVRKSMHFNEQHQAALQTGLQAPLPPWGDSEAPAPALPEQPTQPISNSDDRQAVINKRYSNEIAGLAMRMAYLPAPVENTMPPWGSAEPQPQQQSLEGEYTN